MTKTYTSEWLQWWQPSKDVKVELYQFMAKDNVPFHSIMFPATLLGADEGYVTVSHIMATGMIISSNKMCCFLHLLNELFFEFFLFRVFEL